jgi:HK97 family phage portal protein
VPTQRTIFQRVTKALGGMAPRGIGGGTEGGFFASILGSGRQGSIVSQRRNVPQFLQAYSQLPWLRAVVNKNAYGMGSTEWITLTEDETGQPVPVDEVTKEKHPLQVFFEQPNPYFSWPTLQQLWSIHIDLVGEGFGIWDSTGDYLQIWPITPDCITRLPTAEQPSFELSLKGGATNDIPYDQVFWLTQPDPANPYSRGTGIAQALNDELSTDEAAAKTALAFFENRAKPDLLIYGAGLNAEKTKKLEEAWMDKQQGFWNSFKPHFLSQKVEIKELTQDFQSMQFTDLRRFTRDTIVQVFGIPPEIVGILQNSNRATIEAADLFFSRYTLKPRLDFMKEAIQRQILPKFDDSGLLEIDYVSPVQEDQAMQLEVMRVNSWAFMMDEVRVKAGEDPLPDNKGQIFPVPMNLNFKTMDELSEAAPLPEPQVIQPLLVPPINPDEPQPISQTPLISPPINQGRIGRTVTLGSGRILRLRR